MVDWDPREEMDLIGYLKFRTGRWVEVDTVPDWVLDAHDGYWEGYVSDYGHKPYDEEKIYTGDNLQYRVFHKAVSQGDIRTELYVRIKPG